MKSTGAIEVVAVDENCAVGYIGVVTETNVVVMPVVSPVSPPPAKTAKKADAKAKTKCDTRTIKEESRIRIPARPDPDGLSIHQPRVILGNVNNLRVRGLDDDVLPLVTYLFPQCTLQVSGLLR